MEPFHCIVSLLEEKGSLDFLNALHTKNFYFYLFIIYFFKLFTESFFGNQKGVFLQKPTFGTFIFKSGKWFFRFVKHSSHYEKKKN